MLSFLCQTFIVNRNFILQVSDVVVKDSCPSATGGTGARNQRHLCAINYNVKAGIEIVQGLLDNIMIALKVPFAADNSLKGYYLEGKDCEYFVHISYLRTMVIFYFFLYN